MADARDERREVVDRADEDHPERDPEEGRPPAEELAGDDRPGDRARRRDRASAPEQEEALGRNEVDPSFTCTAGVLALSSSAYCRAMSFP